jgi:hypothetical protein
LNRDVFRGQFISLRVRTKKGPMVEDAAVLAFEAVDSESCKALVRQFFCDNPSANVIEIALSTRDLKPLGTRVWRVLDANLEAVSNIV